MLKISHSAIALAIGAVAVGWTAALPSAQGRADAVIREIAVLDPSGAAWLPRRDVVIRDTRITSVAPHGGALPPAKYTIDGRGKFAIPGLFDNHVHLARFTTGTAGLFVAHGVTSIRDMGTDPERIVSWRRAIDFGTFMGPRIVSACGPMLEGRGEPRVDHRLVNSPGEAAEIVEKIAVTGMDCIKVRTFKDRDTFRAIGAAARARGLILTGHPPEGLTVFEALEAGQRTFEHGFFPYPLSKVDEAERRRMAEALVASAAAYVPTLVAWRPATETIDQLQARLRETAAATRFRLPAALFTHWKNHLPAHQKEGRGSPGWRDAVRTAATDIGALHRMGVLVLPGSDTGSPFVVPGLGLHDELALLVSQSGLTPAEALHRATIGSATFHQRGDDLGSIEPGKIADVLVLAADPLADITHTRRIDTVVFRGETLTRAHLNRLLSQTKSGS